MYTVESIAAIRKLILESRPFSLSFPAEQWPLLSELIGPLPESVGLVLITDYSKAPSASQHGPAAGERHRGQSERDTGGEPHPRYRP